jgi:gamma-glutamylputrescine oxidase
MGPRELSYWEGEAGVEPRPSPSPSPSRADVLIVGAGFCGSWLAYFLKGYRPDLEVVVAERDFLSLGASTRNAGFLSCGNLSEWLEDSKGLGWEETVRTLAARIAGIEIIKAHLGSAIRIDHYGSADFDEITEEKLDLMKRLNAHFDCFEKREARLAGKPREVFFNRTDGQVNPCELLLALHRKARERGVRFLWNTEVASVGGGLAGDLRYGHAFVCTNAFARRLNGASEVRPARGQILVTSACRADTTKTLGFLRSGYDYFRFIGDRVLVGGGRLHFAASEATDTLEATEELRGYLLRLAESVIGHGRFTIDYHWPGIMGLRGGGHASATDLRRTIAIDDKTHEVAGFGGWGVTLAPWLAELKAREFLSLP